jgi:CheY-like chemotaxis protein
MPASYVGDPNRLRQILTNLMNNAIKFTDQGEVCVRARTESSPGGAWVSFEVADTGVGLSKEDQERVFSPFTQGNGSAKSKGGTGLGLTICSRLVSLMGGEIGVRSEPGRGSVFWFRLPLPPAPAVVVRPEPDFVRSRALIVDDNASSLAVLSAQLGAWAIEHEAVASGAAGLEALEVAAATEKVFGLVLFDFDLGDMDGPAFARAIRDSHERYGEPKLVLLTTVDGLPASMPPALVDDWLPKPVRRDQLFERIAGVSRAFEHRPKKVSKLDVPEGVRLLVAEDNTVNQAVALAMLRHLGVQADVVADGRAAVDAVEAGGYALVLMDCQMPELDGYEAATRIRALPAPASETVIVGLTAHAPDEYRERAFEAGMDDYLTKPITLELLGECLERWLVREGLRRNAK